VPGLLAANGDYLLAVRLQALGHVAGLDHETVDQHFFLLVGPADILLLEVAGHIVVLDDASARSSRAIARPG
jgi:hypothetical protein